MKFEDLVGKEADFYMAKQPEFVLDGIAWTAVLDEQDGYRSSMSKVTTDADTFTQLLSMAVDCEETEPLARVRVVRIVEGTQQTESYVFADDGYQLIGVVDGHVWLTIGTSNDDSGYYPCYVFDYTPK